MQWEVKKCGINLVSISQKLHENTWEEFQLPKTEMLLVYIVEKKMHGCFPEVLTNLPSSVQMFNKTGLELEIIRTFFVVVLTGTEFLASFFWGGAFPNSWGNQQKSVQTFYLFIFAKTTTTL